MNKYFSINQKSMADALVFLGFNYYKFDLSCPHTRDFSHELGHA